ncbi:hypothetical protein [Pseudomonas sp.]|uniref:hypothetical protein n=1 Tax=Pseudomonas sp. TaxID=306 RepID=UPI0027325603|nr:hypothetical protein [Pseudomonas sp.]
MNDLGNTEVVAVGGKEVVCRELTVAGLRKVMAESGGTDLANNLLFEELRLSDLPAFTTLTADDVNALRPSEVAAVIAGCKKANPDFFAMLARVRKLQQPA